jgi:putative oxidoreductase
MNDSRGNILITLYELLIRVGNSLQSAFLLVVRLYFGWQFAQAGWGKLHRMPDVIQFFASLGIPAPAANAWFVSLLEFVGGILLMVGIGSRLLSLLSVGDMLVAYLTADRDAFFGFFTHPDKFAAAAPFVFLWAWLIILIFGPGKISIDALLEKYFRGARTEGVMSRNEHAA